MPRDPTAGNGKKKGGSSFSTQLHSSVELDNSSLN